MNCIKYIISGVLLSCWLVQSTSAQVRGNEIRVVVSPDHSDWKYNIGENSTFTIQVFKAQNLLKDVTIDYELGPEMYPAEIKKQILLKDGKLVVKGRMTESGFLRCKVKAYVGERTYEGLATAAYQPEKITPFATLPEDFDAFWATSLSEVRKTALEPTMLLLPERCTETVNVYEVSFQNMRWGSRTYGILCMPKKGGKYPALLRVPGAGIRTYYGDIATASKGAITLEIGVHGIPVTMTQEYYDKLVYGALFCYWDINKNNRDAFYYKRVFIGAVRAVDFICSLPQYNGNALGVTGSSQGGALSVVTAALDKRVTFFAAVHPAMCDLVASLNKRACGWPHYFYQKENSDKTELEATRYYDVVNFARRLSVPGWFSWGYNDEVCPPTSMSAAYNCIASPKELHPYLETGHYWYQEQYDEWNKWLWKQMGIK
ncbi:acetylxylan esterase [Bacteroides ihuae]|uniref:acetylxylan esterase n=1 Tax=Bacteroides ihuae TaxID=1852362 RepID=UPI00098FCA38|nr:acetylxylan esterase [Bacteroides ihuae]